MGMIFNEEKFLKENENSTRFKGSEKLVDMEIKLIESFERLVLNHNGGKKGRIKNSSITCLRRG